MDGFVHGSVGDHGSKPRTEPADRRVAPGGSDAFVLAGPGRIRSNRSRSRALLIRQGNTPYRPTRNLWTLGRQVWRPVMKGKRGLT